MKAKPKRGGYKPGRDSEYRVKKGDVQPCGTCGNDRCSGCGSPLRCKEFIHIFHNEDVCDTCQEKP